MNVVIWEHCIRFEVFMVTMKNGVFWDVTRATCCNIPEDTILHGNIVVLTMRFLDVTKFTTLTPLSLYILCELSFPTVGLKKSSLSTLASKYHNKIFMRYLGNLSNIRSSSS
jgi:hypothetical protein